VRCATQNSGLDTIEMMYAANGVGALTQATISDEERAFTASIVKRLVVLENETSMV
jgi:hypothetical protein